MSPANCCLFLTCHFQPQEKHTSKHIRQKDDISNSGLCRWAEQGRVSCKRLPGGKRIYIRDDILELLGDSDKQPTQKEKVTYARVSSSRVQAHGLGRQRQIDPSFDHARWSEPNAGVRRSNAQGRRQTTNGRAPRGPLRA
jgi:hypothetical protein